MTTGTCLQAHNGRDATRKKKKEEYRGHCHKMDGRCEHGHENGGIRLEQNMADGRRRWRRARRHLMTGQDGETKSDAVIHLPFSWLHCQGSTRMSSPLGLPAIRRGVE